VRREVGREGVRSGAWLCARRVEWRGGDGRRGKKGKEL
jgi:hypothetical protein